MESIARPLRHLKEEASWFARATEVKLLHIATEATLRGSSVDLLMGHEHHSDNRALWVRFDDPIAGSDGGWTARTQRLRDVWADKAAAVAGAGIKLQPLDETGVSRDSAVSEFAGLLLAAQQSLAPPLDGLVIVLAPVRVDESAGALETLASLVTSPFLRHVRWVIVECDGVALLPLAERLGEQALSCSCVVDEAAQQGDLAAQGPADVNRTPPSLPIAPRWRAPGAAPDVAPPPRIGAIPARSVADVRAAGLSPGFVNGGGDALKQMILGAALAMRQGRPVDAVTLQGRAASLCADLEMPREQVLNLHVLGGYVLAAGQPARAREVYKGAGDIARAHGAADLEAQTELALGLIEALDGRPAEAAAHYAAGARLAETVKMDALAIESWRVAGQLALGAGLETSAVECWKKALALADPLDPALAKVTSAPLAALALAALCRKRGLNIQAQSLEQQALALEAAPAPTEEVLA